MAERPKNVRRGGSGEATAAPDARPHGTRAAAERHRYHSEELCSECIVGERDYFREYRRGLRRAPGYLAREAADRRRRHRIAKKRNAMDRMYLVDEVVVNRAVVGEVVAPNRAERLEAVRRLRDRGTPYREMAELLHVTDRQIHRDLAALGLINPAGAVA